MFLITNHTDLLQLLTRQTQRPGGGSSGRKDISEVILHDAREKAKRASRPSLQKAPGQTQPSPGTRRCRWDPSPLRP